MRINSLDIAVKHVSTAVQLAKDGKFYEANLALKAAEESIVMDTFALLETPKAAANWAFCFPEPDGHSHQHRGKPGG